MSSPAERFASLSPARRRVVHDVLVDQALARWKAYAEGRPDIRYRESVTGTDQIVDASLPGSALSAVRSGEGIAAVAERYGEPITAMQDRDLLFPESVTFAYYAIYNFFRKYAMRQDIDDWLIVNQACSSEDDEEKREEALLRAIHEGNRKGADRSLAKEL